MTDICPKHTHVNLCFDCEAAEADGFSGRCRTCTKRNQETCMHEHYDHSLGACHDCGVGALELALEGRLPK